MVLIRVTCPLGLSRSQCPIADDSIGLTLEKVFGKCRPEAVCFLVENGLRTIYAAFFVKAPDQIPTLAEPLFQSRRASVELRPVMVEADLQKGLARWAVDRCDLTQSKNSRQDGVQTIWC